MNEFEWKRLARMPAELLTCHAIFGEDEEADERAEQEQQATSRKLGRDA